MITVSCLFRLCQLEKKSKQLDEGLRKGDKEYYDCCKKSELAREEWESTLYKV